MPIQKVTSGIIADGAIVATDIADGTVTGPKLGPTSINANNIVNATITGNKIATGQITGNLLTSNCVAGNNIVSSPTITGNVTINGSLGIGGATPAASGFGITFPATQSASTDANTLDDYEEGTFTPTVFYSGGTTGTQTYTTQVGRYIKIGKLVCANIRLAFSKNTLSGGYIGGIASLPFTSSTTSSIATISNVAWYNPSGTGFVNLLAYLDPNKTQIDVYRLLAANVDSAVLPIAVSEMGTSIVLTLNHYYYTD